MTSHVDHSHPHDLLFTDSGRDLFRRAIETWGVHAQVDLGVEECAELTVELCHRRRNKNDIDDVVEELADIRIMYEQLRYWFGADAVDARVERKMNRLQERIEEAGG